MSVTTTWTEPNEDNYIQISYNNSSYTYDDTKLNYSYGLADNGSNDDAIWTDTDY